MKKLLALVHPREAGQTNALPAVLDFVFDFLGKVDACLRKRVFRCLEALGIQDTDKGIIRVSLIHYSTTNEVGQLIEELSGL